MRRLFPLVVLVLSAAALAAEPRDISAAIEIVRAKYKLPVCASAVIEGGRFIPRQDQVGMARCRATVSASRVA